MESPDVGTDGRSRKILQNTILLSARMLLVLCIGLYTSRVVLSTLGVSDYGIYAVAGGVVTVFAFLKSALTNSTYRFFACDIAKGNITGLGRTFSMSVNVFLALAVVVAVASESVGRYFIVSRLNIPASRIDAAMWVYHASLLAFVIDLLRTPYASAVIAHEEMGALAILTSAESVAKLVAVLFLGAFGSDMLISYAVSIMVVGAVVFVGNFWYCVSRHAECRYQPVWDSEMFFGLIKYSSWSLIVNVADALANQSIVFFFNIYFGVAANAALGVANQINNNLLQFLQSLSQSFNPAIIKAYAANDRNYFRILIYSTSRFSFYLLLLVSVPILVGGEFLLSAWLGSVPKWAFEFVFLTLIYSLIDAYSAPLWISVHAHGDIKGHQIIMAVIKILNIPLIYLAINCGFGMYYALSIKAALNFVCSIVRPIYVRKMIGISALEYFVTVAGRVYLVALMSGAGVWIVRTYIGSGDWLHFVLSCTLGMSCTMAIIVWGGMNSSERSLAIGAIRSRLSRFL